MFKNKAMWSAMALMSAMGAASASVTSGGGTVVAAPTPETYATISGEIQTTSGRFTDQGLLTLADGAGYNGVAVSAFVDVSQGVFGASASALPSGVSNATVDFRNRSVVQGVGADRKATLHVELAPYFIAGIGGSLDAPKGINPNDMIDLDVSYRTADTYGGIEFKIAPGFSSAACGSAFLLGHTRECLSPNQGLRAFDIQFNLPASGSWLSIESAMWLQALDGDAIGLGSGVRMSLTVPEGVSLASDLGAFPTTSVPELSTGAGFAWGGVLLACVARSRRGKRYG